MSPEYKNLRSQADKLFMRFQDVVDDRNAAQGLMNEIRNVVEDLEMSKNPRSIDDRVKRVIQMLHGIDNSNPAVMSAHDIDDLIDRYEDLRRDLRELPNY